MKQILSNLKMMNKSLAGPLLVLLLLIILGVVSYRGILIQQEAMDTFYNQRFKGYQDASRILSNLTEINLNIYKVINWSHANYEEKKIDQLRNEQIKLINQEVESFNKIAGSKTLSSEEQKLFQETLPNILDYKKTSLDAIDMSTADLNTATVFMGSVDDKFQIVSKNVKNLLELENKLSKNQYSASAESSRLVKTVLIIVMAAAIFLSLIIGIYMAKIITNPIRELIEVIKKVADGDLTEEITLISRDEIGELAQSVNSMKQKLGEMVSQSTDMSQTLSDAASQQAAAIEETSSSLDELASMTRQNAGNAAEADRLMSFAKEKTAKTQISMEQLSGAIKEIVISSEQSQKIIKTIDEIAFQTNLLALNAAVEAARAGEAGAGFAVVADEVRNLAMRAAEAAKNTSNHIENIVKKVKEGATMVATTDQDFKQVADNTAKAVNLVGEIASASKEQSLGIEQINKAAAEMNIVTQKNAASAEELAAIMSMFKINGAGGSIKKLEWAKSDSIY
jgi:methyl-accepting chemotaxis protein